MTNPIKTGTYTPMSHHSLPHIMRALKIAEQLAVDVGTDNDLQVIKYAMKLVDLCEIERMPNEQALLEKFYDECKENASGLCYAK